VSGAKIGPKKCYGKMGKSHSRKGNEGCRWEYTTGGGAAGKIGMHKVMRRVAVLNVLERFGVNSKCD